MATEILRPQDCLIERIRAPPVEISRRRISGNNCNNYSYYYNYNNHHVANTRSSRKPSTRPEQRKRVGGCGSGMPKTAAHVVKRSSADDSRMARNSGVSMEKVTILRRGTSLDSSSLSVKTDMYAGSAFSVSPSPSALPLPSFSTRKQCSTAVDDLATRDLRRLLRLE